MAGRDPGSDEKGAVPTPYVELLRELCREQPTASRETFEAVVEIAVEIAREGREGRRIGTLFIIGDEDRVLERSRCLILDPLAGHSTDAKRISDRSIRETLKELAQLDGAFIVSGDGVVLSACRFIDAATEGLALPLGLGSRHMAGASITRETEALAVVVSESSVVRIFHRGELQAEILPEVWMWHRLRLFVEEPYTRRQSDDVTVVSRQRFEDEEPLETDAQLPH